MLAVGSLSTMRFADGDREGVKLVEQGGAFRRRFYLECHASQLNHSLVTLAILLRWRVEKPMP